MTTSTIGGVGADYATVEDWWAAMPSTLTSDWVGKVIADCQWGSVVMSTSVNFSGFKAHLVGSTSDGIGGVTLPSVELTDSAGIRSAAVSEGNFVIERLWLKGVVAINGFFSSGGPLRFVFRDCYLQNTVGSRTMFAPYSAFQVNAVENCVVESQNSPGNNGWIADPRDAGGAPFVFRNCLVLQMAASPDLAFIRFDNDAYGIYSCGIFAPNGTWGRNAIFSSSSRGDYNYGDDASIGSNFLGSNNLAGVSLVDAIEAGDIWLVESIADRDFRLKPAPNSVAISGGSPTDSTESDHLGVARGSPPSAGPFELAGLVSTESYQLRHNPRTNKVIPVLSAPTVTDIGANCVRPRVTKGY